MNLKTPKKKKVKVKYFIYMFIIYIVFAYTFYYTMKNNPKITNEEFINFLLNGGSIKTFEEMSIPKVVNNTVNFFLNIDFTNLKIDFDVSFLLEIKLTEIGSNSKFIFNDIVYLVEKKVKIECDEKCDRNKQYKITMKIIQKGKK